MAKRWLVSYLLAVPLTLAACVPMKLFSVPPAVVWLALMVSYTPCAANYTFRGEWRWWPHA